MSAEPTWDPVAGHHPGCHACGEHGLGLRLWVDGEQARGEIALSQRHAGSPHHAHGGVIAELLDEVMGTVPLIHEMPAVTGTLEIRYRAPAFLGRTYQVTAHLVGVQRRRILVEGTVTGPHGLVAEGSGTWVRVDLEHYRAGPEG